MPRSRVGRNGQVLAEVPFAIDFQLLTDPPMTLETAPFALVVPYPSNAAQIQIVRSGNVVAVHHRAKATPRRNSLDT